MKKACRICSNAFTPTGNNQPYCFSCSHEVKKSREKNYQKFYKRKRSQKEYMRKYAEKSRDNIDTYYVKRIFYTLGFNNPTKEQIEQKKATIKLKRLIHEKSKSIALGNH